MDINSALKVFERNDKIMVILKNEDFKKSKLIKGTIVNFSPKLCISTNDIDLVFINYDDIFAIFEDKENKKINFDFKE